MGNGHEAQILEQPASKLFGYLVEFADVPTLLAACERIRDAGFTKWDAHSPYPVHGLNDAMGLKATRLPYLVFLCGLTGMGLALLMQWWMNAHDYPYLISGKPIFSLPANIPVIFELTVLLSAFGTVFGMFMINGLPRYHHPVFYSERFKSATNDKYYISLDASDPKFDSTTIQMLESLHGVAVDPIEVEE